MNLTRHASAKIEVDRSHGLRADHPAVVDGRTLFPSMVAGTDVAPRFLVSGHNNPKLGKQVLKGPRAGWPIYHLSLEERATCPRSCAMWRDCYGNAMPYARRHTPDAGFIDALKAEVQTLARAHRGGLLMRLHALGDFYSTEYVRAWADLLDAFPQVHVFGYTARDPDSLVNEERQIGMALRWLTEQAWDRFAIRFSRSTPGPQRSVVYDEAPADPQVIMCPAQVEKTVACASCGLCWADAARDRTIGFLRHGMKRRIAPKPPAPKSPRSIPTDVYLQSLRRLAKWDSIAAAALARHEKAAA